MPHIHDLIDFTVEVYVVHDGKVLLRKHDKYNIWLSVGGHIELDEDPNQAAIREVQEEVGLDISLYDPSAIGGTKQDMYTHLIPPMFMHRHPINESHEHIALIYFAKTSEAEINQNVTEETSSDLRWFDKDGLEKLDDILTTVRHYALTALNDLS